MELKDFQVELTCPFGHECERIDTEKKKIYRCRFYKGLVGENPQTKEKIDEMGCSLGDWMPILQVEIAQTNRGQTAALESFRNEVIGRASQPRKVTHNG